MTKREIISELERLGKDRQWLAEQIGYRYEYVKNSLAPSAAEPNIKFTTQVKRAFSEEERRSEIDLKITGTSVWDLVYFNAPEIERINQARRAGGYNDLKSFYRDAVIEFADGILRKEAEDSQIISANHSRD